MINVYNLNNMKRPLAADSGNTDFTGLKVRFIGLKVGVLRLETPGAENGLKKG